MHYYRPINYAPVKPYNNFRVSVPNDFFSIAAAKAYFDREAKAVKQPELSPRVFYVLTYRSASEIQENLLGATVESI